MKKSFITSTTVVVAKTIQLDQISAFQISIEVTKSFVNVFKVLLCFVFFCV